MIIFIKDFNNLTLPNNSKIKIMADSFINPNNAIDKTSKDSGSKSPYSLRNATAGYSYTKKNKSSSASRLRVGEIMQGEILQTFGDGIAKVKLPPGVMKAQLTDNLQTGDELVFVVHQVEKGLVLKIHSVSSIYKGENREISEIIRILNLQNTNFYQKAITFLRKRRQYIYREECMQLLYNFNKLSPFDYNDVSGKTIFKNLLFFIDNKIEMTQSLFRKTKFAFSNRNVIEKSLNSLKNELNIKYSNDIEIINNNQNYLEYYSTLKLIQTQLNAIRDNLNMQNFFLIKEESFASNIIKLFTQNVKYNPEITKEINYIAKYINAIEIVRIVQKTARKPYKIRVPYIELNQIKIVDILFDIFGKNIRYVFNLSAKFSVQVESKGNFHNIIIYSNEENLYIYNFIDKIKSILTKENINSLVEIRDLSQLNKYPEADTILLRNQTFVV